MATFNLNGIDFNGISTDRSRLTELAQWLGERVTEKPCELTVASADASFRSYYRVKTPSRQFIVMDAPPPAEDTRPFHALAELLLSAGVAVPNVYGWAPEPGFMLLEDFGNTTLLASLGKRVDGQALGADTKALYERALETIVHMQTHAQPDSLPEYDGPFLIKEMELFRRWLVHRHLELSWSLEEEREWQRTTDQLVKDALAQPKAFVHRDYHSRNLMVRSTGETASDSGDAEWSAPGVLDFQDAMHGPVFYDVVSLLKDCYVSLNADDLNHLLAFYIRTAQHAGLGVDSNQESARLFHAVGMQRHLKAAGIFARLWHRDGKEAYLNDIPRTLGYLVEAGKEDAHYQWLSRWIERRVLPKLNAIKASS